MSARSLRLRLIVYITVIFIVAAASTSALVLNSCQRQINQDYDAQLIADAHVLWHMLREDLSEGDKIGEVTMEQSIPSLEAQQLISLNLYTHWRAFRIWRHKRLVAWTHSTGLPDQPQAAAGFSQVPVGASHWRVYTLLDPQADLTVEAWENLDNRTALRNSILADLATPALALLPVIVVLLLIGMKWMLVDISRLVRRIASRRQDNLEPIDMPALPAELRPLLDALNQLLVRLSDSLQRERQLLDSTAHELRTPLAALKLQAQLVAHAKTDADRQDSLLALEQGIERTCALADQLLILAQLCEHSVQTEPVATLDILKRALVTHAVIAHDKDIALMIEGVGGNITANPDLLQILASILLDNAIKYTPSSGQVVLQADADGFTICDSGPGIPEADRERVFERFVRLDRSQTGTGLGLFIAREICQAHGWHISLGAGQSGTGLAVAVSFSPQPLRQ